MNEYAAIFVEQPERVSAFQFLHLWQLERVLGELGGSIANYTLERRDNKFRLTFPPARRTNVEKLNQGFATITLTNGVGVVDGYNSVVMEGSWIVKRYLGTDHEATEVMDDREFKRKYGAE